MIINGGLRVTFIASSPINIFIVGEQCCRIIKKPTSICPFSQGKELNHASFFCICHGIVGADTFELLDILLFNLLSMKGSFGKKNNMNLKHCSCTFTYKFLYTYS